MAQKEKILIVGAGLFGSVIAERFASDAGARVRVIDKRSHIGGNCFSRIDQETGIECHQYGSHIFHTSEERVWAYINRFTRFNGYRHVVHTKYGGQVYTMPINLGTINAFYNLNLIPSDVDPFINREIARENIHSPKNLEEKAISLIGRPLYEAFIRGYTMKQWACDPRELPEDIITRLPVRHSYNTRYFDDLYEGIPLSGYTTVFQNILDHPRITISLNTDYTSLTPSERAADLTIFTGPIDRYFNYIHGRLDWRSIVLKRMVHKVTDYQGCSVLNYADADVSCTRIHEFKHFHPERPDTLSTTTFTEYPRVCGKYDDPYYPVNTPRNMKLLERYQELASQEPNVLFGGRLGSYRYLDMDDTIAAALDCYERLYS